MTEYEPMVDEIEEQTPFGDYPVEVADQRMRAFERYMVGQASPRQAERLGRFTYAHNVCLAYHLQTDPDLRKKFADILRLKVGGHLSPSNLGRRVLKMSVAMEISGEPSALDGRDEPAGWDPMIQSLLTDPSYSFRYTAGLFLPVTASKSDRYKVVQAELAMADKTEAAVVYDWAGGAGVGAIRLALQTEPKLQFAPLTVYERTGSVDDNQAIAPNPALESAVNARVQQPLPTSAQLTTIDMFDAKRDSTFRKRTRSDTFTMEDLYSHPQKVAMYDYLLSHIPDNVHFQTDSIADPEIELPDASADAIIVSTAYYQMKRRDIAKSIKIMERKLKPDGIGIILDFIKDFPAHGTPTFHNDWTEWTYGAYVLDMRRRDLGWQKHFTINSGNTNAAIVEPAALARL